MSILTNGTSALLAYQRALNVVSHNIANANTEGYSRQTVDFVARVPEGLAARLGGSGVEIGGIKRLYDEHLAGQVRTNTASLQEAMTYHKYAEHLSNIFADPDVGLATRLQGFFDAIQEVANDPASTSARQVLLSESQSLVDRFREIDAYIEGVAEETNSQIATSVSEINQLAGSIGELNRSIAEFGTNGQAPNDLLDQRDLLIKKLSEHVAVQVVNQGDGTVSVSIGNGQRLVVGAEVERLVVLNNPLDPSRSEVGYTSDDGAFNISKQLSGGILGGALTFRREVADPVRNDLGRLAIALGSDFNAQHGQGVDLYGELGTDFFEVATPGVTTHPDNTGAATVDAAITDVSTLGTSDYVLRFDGATWSMERFETGEAVSLSGSGSAADPLTAEGLSIVVSAGANAGDRFLVQPTRRGASELGLNISDTRRVAAASVAYVSEDIANKGSGTISASGILDGTDPALLNTVRIQFTAPGVYDVVDETAGSVLATGVAYVDGGNIDYNGWRVQISGSANPGDVFRVKSGGPGNNENALSLAGLQNRRVLDNGTTTYQQAYGEMVSGLGTKTYTAQMSRDAREAVLEHAQSAFDNISGVNLDEEAATLIKYQQAYQAAAKVVSAAQDMFQTLLRSF